MLLLPLIGVFGWVTGAAYPYYRFMNATVALFALVGLGAYVAIKWLWGRAGAAKVAGILASLLIVASLGFIWVNGREVSNWADPEGQWIDQPTRTALSAAGAIVADAPEDSPIVFIVNYGDTYQAYGWSKTFTNVSRTGLPGDAVKRSMTYFGAVEDFLADRPTVLTDDTYNTMSRAFYDELTDLREEYAGPPVAFLVRQFNEGTGNEELLDSGDASLLALGDDIAVVTGEGLTSPSDGAHRRGARGRDRGRGVLRRSPGDPREHRAQRCGSSSRSDSCWSCRALLAARFFELDDTWLKISLIPGISIALTVHRRRDRRGGDIARRSRRRTDGRRSGWRPPAGPSSGSARRRSSGS